MAGLENILSFGDAKITQFEGLLPAPAPLFLSPEGSWGQEALHNSIRAKGVCGISYKVGLDDGSVA